MNSTVKTPLNLSHVFINNDLLLCLKPNRINTLNSKKSYSVRLWGGQPFLRTVRHRTFLHVIFLILLNPALLTTPRTHTHSHTHAKPPTTPYNGFNVSMPSAELALS